MSEHILAGALYCGRKLEPADADHKRFLKNGRYTVRYAWNFMTETHWQSAGENLLDVVFYTRNRRQAEFYEFEIEDHAGSLHFIPTNNGDVEWKSGKWVVDSSFWGLATIDRIHALANAIRSQKPQLVPFPHEQPHKVICEPFR